MKIHAPLPEKLLLKLMAGFIMREDGCWIWQHYVDKRGYGRLGIGNGQFEFTHRLMFIAFYGDIPQGKEIDHICNTKACMNPKHLEAVSHRLNTMRARGQYQRLRRTLEDVPPEVRAILRQVAQERGLPAIPEDEPASAFLAKKWTDPEPEWMRA